MSRKISRTKILFTSCVIILFVSIDFLYHHLNVNKRQFDIEDDVSKDYIDKSNPVFVITICKSLTGNTTLQVDVQRQFEQAFVLLKSAALFTSKVLRFIVIVNHEDIFKELLAKIEDWPERIRRNIILDKKDIWFPDKEDFEKLFRLCSTERLFLVENLPNEDSVVYLDTDTMFLHPPENLWGEFSKFNSIQMSGLSPSLYFYSPDNPRIPVYGQSGVNAGVWMMNLTRMRHFPGGWINTCINVTNEYRSKLLLGDQDIANVIFNRNSEFLYELPCRWNYRDNICHINKHPCKRIEITGIFLLHGNAMYFYKDHNQKFKVMFNEFLNFDVNRPLIELLWSIRASLRKIKYSNNASKCLRLSIIDDMLSRSLSNYIFMKN
ncbi:UNVERIFIED_CONTAM: hypothetical protein RMT77_005550 [Armadillidium vulgare]